MHRLPPPTPVDSARRPLLRVLVEVWESACCGPAPVVGAEVSYRLDLQVDPVPHDLPGPAGTHAWTLLRPGVVAVSGAEVHWAGVPADERGGTVTGHLTGTRHGGSLPEDLAVTAGEVVGVRVVRHVHVLDLRVTPRR